MTMIPMASGKPSPAPATRLKATMALIPSPGAIA